MKCARLTKQDTEVLNFCTEPGIVWSMQVVLYLALQRCFSISKKAVSDGSSVLGPISEDANKDTSCGDSFDVNASLRMVTETANLLHAAH